MENVELNEFQTPLSELNLDKQPDEVKEQFLDFFYNVPFILNLTSKDRKRAKDLPRDDKGRIIIDITHPHILEDMDYFRPAAIYYQQHGCYTKLRPNDNPNSEFGKWITEEVRRCREGYVRESDGEWITGDYYYFLNYAPMQLVKKEDKNSKKGRRVFDFPNVWEGHYLKSHALNLAREQGHHYAELSSRGRGKAHPYDEFVYTTTGIKKWGDIQIGDYVYGDDGKPTKIIDIPFDDVCPIYEITLANGRKVKCSEGHLWKVVREDTEIECVDTKYLADKFKNKETFNYSVVSHRPVEFKQESKNFDYTSFISMLKPDITSIPDECKYGPFIVKFILLAKFLEKCYSNNENEIVIEFESTSLLEDIRFMMDSIGMPYLYKNEHCIAIEKKEKKFVCNKITNIEYIGEQKAKCITVDNESHCYLINNFITTHNSFYAAAMLAKRFILGESKEVNKKVVSYITADDRKYLVGGDQTLDKFLFDIDWASNNMEWPSKRLINSLSNMLWIMGYKDMDSGTNKGTLNSVIGVTSKDDPQKLRGTRGVLYVIEEMGCHIKGTEVLMYDGSTKKVEDIKVGDVLMGNDNTPRVVQLCHNGVDLLYKITLSNGDYQIVNSKHPVYFKKYDWNKRQYSEHLLTAPELMQIKDLNKGYYISKAIINFPYKKVYIDPYFLGLWLGDGDSSRLDISNEDFEVLNWLKTNYKTGVILDLKQSATCKNFHIRKTDCIYNNYFKELNLYNNKHIPTDYKINSSEIQLQVIAGLIDTDGTYSKKKNFFEITQRFDRKHILDDIKFMCECNGLKCKMSSRIGTGLKKGVLHYRLRISGDLSIIPTKIERKKGIKNDAYRSRKIWNDYTFKVEPFGLGEFYGFTVDKNHLFVLKDLTITHNTFPALLDLIGNLRPSVEDGEDVFGTIVAYGTSADKESDFTSAQEIVYNPEGYNFIAFDNVYDKVGLGKRKFAFFFPGYLNMANCYDSNGNSDVTKALLSILKDRYFVKYHSTNINAISKRIAEIPITPQEAMLKSRGNIFPVTQLTLRLNEMDNNPTFHDSTYVGELVQNSKGEIIFLPTKDEPIREYPIKNNKEAGAIEIWKMPEKDSYGKVMQNRYIIGHDPVDLDAADTASLTSTFVLDTFTDLIVAEYTGRQQFADDNFEIVRKLCLFYNAKCLYEAHPYSQIVYTPDGRKLWKDIKIGDKLFSPTKGIVTVTNIPVDEKMPIYNITLSDGRTVLASDNHIWLVYKGTSKTPIELTTKQMLDIGIKNKHNLHLFFIPQNNGVEYNTKQLPIDPYTMGLILAEGSIIGSHCFKNGLQISSSFEDMKFYKQNIPYEIKHIGVKGFSWYLYIDDCKDILTKYNLYGTNSHTKFIPKDYLFSDRIQRMELLKGLMDGDGCASTDGAAIFTTCSNKLAQDIMLLVRSLGIKCWLLIPRPDVYRVAIASTNKVFKLPRKVEKQHIYLQYKKGSKASAILNKTAIVNIEYSHDEMGKCVTVDSEDGLYLIGDYITTHNCNKKGMFAYFQKFNCLWLLKDTPQYLKDVDIVKTIGYGNNAKGVNATLPVNNYANEKIRDWLLKPVTSINPDTGEEITVPNLAFIRSRALLKELIAFNPDINVDRVRALGMVMLYREEMLINGRGTIDKKERKPKIEDEYFSKNYDLKFGIFH